MSTSQAGTNPGTSPVDQPITSAQFLDNWVKGRYEELPLPLFLSQIGPTTQTRVLARLKQYDKKGRQLFDKKGNPVFLNQSLIVTDLAPLTSFSISSPLDALTPKNLNIDIQAVAGMASVGPVAGALPTTPLGSQNIAFSQEVTGAIDVAITPAVLRAKLGNTLRDKQSAAPQSVANGTAETALATGAVTLAIGDRVTCSLAAGPPSLATSADILTYVALKGAGTLFYYAVAFLGEAISVEFTADAAEKLNIVAANADTVAHAFSGYFHAVIP